MSERLTSPNPPEPDTSVLCDAAGLRCERGGRELFRDLSFTLERGTLLELRGPNGSGKSTLLRALAGLYPDVEGDIETGALAYFGHRGGLSPSLTVAENLAWFLGLAGSDTTDLSALLRRVDVPYPDRLLAQLSAGQQRRVGLARLLMTSVAKPLWLLDEPLTALDSAGEALVGELIEEHLAAGGGVVCATHQDLPLAPGARIELGR